jgi:hypothetical protein
MDLPQSACRGKVVVEGAGQRRAMISPLDCHSDGLVVTVM